MTHHPYARAALLAGLIASQGGIAAAEIREELLTSIDTRLSIPDRTGRMGWLDANTLAVTTEQKPGEYWNGRIMAFDLRTRTARLLMDNAFLHCSNPQAGAVAATKGSYVRMFWGPQKAGDTPDPVRVFYAWDARTGTLGQEQPGKREGWNWHICMPTRPEDTQAIDLEFLQRNVRYLQPQHGVLRWTGERDTPEGKAVFLESRTGARRRVAVQPEEIGVTPQYQPASDGYVLTTGRFMLGNAYMERRGERTQEVPAITMRTNGEVTRWPLAPELRQDLEGRKATHGDLIPFARGVLVHVGGWRSNGAGLYAQERGAIRKVWCEGSVPPQDPKCSMEGVLLSPDGCKLAYLPQGSYMKTVHVLDVCTRPS